MTLHICWSHCIVSSHSPADNGTSVLKLFFDFLTKDGGSHFVGGGLHETTGQVLPLCKHHPTLPGCCNLVAGKDTARCTQGPLEVHGMHQAHCACYPMSIFFIRKWLIASGMEKQKCCIRRKNASYYYLTFWHTRRRLLNRYILEVCEICMWVYVCFLGDTSTFNDVQLHIIITH